MARISLQQLEPKEKDILASILDYLVLSGAIVLRVNSGAVKGEYHGKARYIQFIRFPDELGLPDDMKKSCSDILACFGGRFVAIEVKAARGKLTQKQGNFLNAVRIAGGLAFVARSIDDVRDALPVGGKPATIIRVESKPQTKENVMAEEKDRTQDQEKRDRDAQKRDEQSGESNRESGSNKPSGSGSGGTGSGSSGANQR